MLPSILTRCTSIFLYFQPCLIVRILTEPFTSKLKYFLLLQARHATDLYIHFWGKRVSISVFLCIKLLGTTPRQRSVVFATVQNHSNVSALIAVSFRPHRFYVAKFTYRSERAQGSQGRIKNKR